MTATLKRRRGPLSVSQTLIFAVSIALFVFMVVGRVHAAEDASPSLLPNPLNFPDQSFTPQSATSAIGTIKVANPPAGAKITFSNISSTQPDFAVTGGTCKISEALAPGDSCTVLVTFKPVQGGHRQATLFVEWGANQVKEKVHLSGVATAPK